MEHSMKRTRSADTSPLPSLLKTHLSFGVTGIVVVPVVAGAAARLAAAAARQRASRPRATVILKGKCYSLNFRAISNSGKMRHKTLGKTIRTSPSSQVHNAAAASLARLLPPFARSSLRCESERSCRKAVEAAEEGLSSSSGSVSCSGNMTSSCCTSECCFGSPLTPLPPFSILPMRKLAPLLLLRKLHKLHNNGCQSVRNGKTLGAAKDANLFFLLSLEARSTFFRKNV